MDDTNMMPAAFKELSELAGAWGRANEHARNEIRWRATREDFAELYAAVFPRLGEILHYFSGLSLEGMSKADRNLFDLASAFAEASPHHELYGGSNQVPFSFDARRFVPNHGGTGSAAL